MSEEGLDKLRLDTARFAVSEARRVRRDYRGFARREVPEDAKGYAAHHSACKTALGHLEALVKLARWASEKPAADDGSGGSDGPDLARLLSEARTALSGTGGQRGDEQ